MKSTITIVCNGGESSFFTNIVINVDPDCTPKTSNCDSMLVCDGYASCNNIPSYIKLTEENVSTRTSSDYSISVRFRTVYWYLYFGQIVESELDHQFSSDKKYNDRSDVLCNSFDSCYHATMVHIKSVHCHGRLSCTHAVIGNFGHRIWMHSQHYAIGAFINGVGNDLHFRDTYSCYSCNVANISGEIFGGGQGSLAHSTAKNVARLLCSGGGSCWGSKFFSVARIEQRQDVSLGYAQKFSDMINHHNNYSNNYNNSNDSNIQ